MVVEVVLPLCVQRCKQLEKTAGETIAEWECGWEEIGASFKHVPQWPGVVLSPRVGSKSTGWGAAEGLALKHG